MDEPKSLFGSKLEKNIFILFILIILGIRETQCWYSIQTKKYKTNAHAYLASVGVSIRFIVRLIVLC